MRIFVSEYLTSGAFTADGTSKARLAAEGAAMLRALAADAVAIPGWNVAVSWDAALGPFGVSDVDIHLAGSPVEELRRFTRLAAEADTTLVIAPEFDGLLENRRRLVDAIGGRFVGPTAEAIALCADKLALARYLTGHDVPTIETRICDFAQLSATFEDAPPGGYVVKPRHGAGSMNTFHVTNAADVAEAEAVFAAGASTDGPIVQPYVSGIPLSIAGIASAQGVELLPVCRQRISGGTRLHYAGGTVPAETGLDDAVADLARRAFAAVPGLYGYVGIDVLLTKSQDAQPLVVEINPRLTSSYHGYRRLAIDNLAERILAPDVPRPPVRWRTGRIDYLPDGTTMPRESLLKT